MKNNFLSLQKEGLVLNPIGDIFSKILGEPMVNRCPEDDFAFVMPLNLERQFLSILMSNSLGRENTSVDV